ncbi:glycoside hydrolase family 28 protein [Halalkalibacter urbisdiaboli]|uniref:glycoside hydrolase family 28 protein n=1 Tax=Halalkalibacter urbisdiaboli TaxID=1960589 RepID=UPI001FDA1B91|nr:glycoside hydrolase family 28 protein [Halalkalibacter urbisdiaboli]
MTFTQAMQEHITILQPNIPEQTFLLTDFAAVGDGVHDNTEAFRQVIDACSKAGGGKVIIPPGIWYTGPIRLKSKLNLHVEAGAIVVFSRQFDDYPLIASSFEGEEIVRCQSPIDGEGLQDVAITGSGIFDGSGDAWRPVKRFKMTDSKWKKLLKSGGVVEKTAETEIWWPTEQAMKGNERYQELRKTGSKESKEFESIRDFLRPNLLSIRHSKRVLLDGPTFKNSPAWCLHPWVCEHVTIQNVQVKNPWYSQNGDGLDLESCRYALIENCIFDVGDDAICIKSGKDEAGRKLGKRCEDVVINGCQVYSGHGGFVIGSEMSGGVRNIHVNDCSFIGTDTGLRFKSARGRGGIVENVTIRNIRMVNIAKEAIVFQMFYVLSKEEERAMVEEPVSERTPIFRNMSIQDVQCIGAADGLVVKGLPEMPLEGLVFKNVALQSTRGISLSECKQIKLDSVSLNVEEGPLVDIYNCRNLKLNDIQNVRNIEYFVKTAGEKTADVTLFTKAPLEEKAVVIEDHATIDVEVLA